MKVEILTFIIVNIYLAGALPRMVELEFENVKYKLHGLWPQECMHDNVWRCQFNYMEI